jgi:hypothetical protein
MSTKNILLNSKPILLHKATIDPDFNKKSILVENPWEYVELWIKRHGNSDALFYWQQANGFYEATKQLPKTSSPLPAYYCFLNATKALLEIKGIKYQDKHGVTGFSVNSVSSLSNEIIKFQSNGVLSELSRLLGESVNGEEYTFKNLIYNLGYIHRAYNLTFSSDPEIFYPIHNPHFVLVHGQNEAYFTSEIKSKYYQNQNTINKLPARLERDLGKQDMWVIRSKKRFRWLSGSMNKSDNLGRLKLYHKTIRRDIHFIYGSTDLWYFKRTGFGNSIEKSPLSISFSLMHRLSELSRYDPIRLKKHFDCQHNWLLSEFINLAPTQFIYGIACEITGQEFKIPGIRK